MNFTEPGWYANDTLDGNITARVVVTGTVDVWKPARTSVVLLYNVRDMAGNNATQRSRTVIIIDTIAPIITIVGSANVQHEAATVFVDAGARAWDLLYGNLTSSIVTVNPVNVNSASGTRFFVTYNVQDPAGNRAVQQNRSVTIIDSTLPVLTLLGNATFYLQGSFPWIDPGCLAWDTLNGI
jgi:hypothetical protein